MPQLTATYVDPSNGTTYDLTGESVEELAAQLPEDASDASITVRDEQDCVRGWIHSRADWRAQ
jgi:hypothetical protein